MSGAVAAQRVAGASGDARAETLDRIADLLSRLPEDKYFAKVGQSPETVAPTSVLDRLSRGYGVDIYRDDGKSSGWLGAYSRETGGDEIVASMSGNMFRQASVEQLRAFEASLRAHELSAGLLPRDR